jgi:RHS repeat-associated protein
MQMSKRESPRGIREGQWSILSVQVFVNEEISTTAQSITYDEFGNQLSNSNPDFQPFGYAGGLTDYHTDLIRFGARDYDPSVGRWTSKEPLGFAGALNFYVYCDNDGVNWVDPDGELAFFATVFVTVALIGVALSKWIARGIDNLDDARKIGLNGYEVEDYYNDLNKNWLPEIKATSMGCEAALSIINPQSKIRGGSHRSYNTSTQVTKSGKDVITRSETVRKTTNLETNITDILGDIILNQSGGQIPAIVE